MTQIFVQTTNRILDISKIAYMKLETRPGSSEELVEVTFTGGQELLLRGNDAVQLLESIAELASRKHLVAWHARVPASHGERGGAVPT